jgi:glutamate dehydrogenase/leucine dehydrogenase
MPDTSEALFCPINIPRAINEKGDRCHMEPLEINQIPAEILSRFNTHQIVLITTEDLKDKVLGTTTFDPHALQEIEGLEKLVALRKSEGVYSITVSIIALDQSSIDEAATEFDNKSAIVDELNGLLKRFPKVYVAYAVTHFNHKPMDELTVFIGGDCYRTGAELKDLDTVLRRTKNLAKAMIRKAVVIFPDIPTLHGGKKGEWIILDGEGKKIEELSEAAIIALGTLIIPKGIKFLNDYKEKTAIEKGIFESFPERNVIRPDTASPDVLSGPNWKTMCEVWNKREKDLSYVTCLPGSLNGPLVPSSYPTGYGVVATALKLVNYYFQDRPQENMRFLLEALGGVGQATVEALLKKGYLAKNITGFDRSAERCAIINREYGIETLPVTYQEFYRTLDESRQYDVWINNGEGDNTRPEYIDKLIKSGVKIFCGAANNFLKLTDKDHHNSENSSDRSLEKESLSKIFSAGGWAWPDEAASAGGWTLAVIDVLSRSKGEKSSSSHVREQILDTIISRNEKLVDDVVGKLIKEGQVSGEAIWHQVGQLINERVKNTLEREFSPEKIAERADVTGWKLT